MLSRPASQPLARRQAPATDDIGLGIGYLTAYLASNGFAAAQLETIRPVSGPECVREILRRKPKVLGLSVYDSNYPQCRFIAESVRRADDKIIVVFGGPSPSVQPEFVLEENPFVHVCVRHEGEETTLELLALLESRPLLHQTR